MQAELRKKIAKVKEEIGGVITKKSENPYFNSKYADLNTHLDLIEPVLKANNLVLTQPIIENRVYTQLLDLDSDSIISFSLTLPPLEDMQKIGGAITYARRYMLTSYFALKAEDDDGETAVGRGGAKKVAKKPASKKFKKPVEKKPAPVKNEVTDDEEDLF
jgi:hypothetical protein